MKMNILLVSFAIARINSLQWPCPTNATECIAGGKHKTHAGSETATFAECTNYQDNSCCDANFTEQLATSDVTHIVDVVGGQTSIFNWSHCGGMSERCEMFFIEIECFYRCSPNMIYFEGSYPASIDRLPICSSYCNHWFDACQDDLACVNNWVFEYEYNDDGVNTCPNTSNCTTFESRYTDAEGLCNTLWGNTFNYTEESSLCLTPGNLAGNSLVVSEMFDTECSPNTTDPTDGKSKGNKKDGGIAMLIIGIILMVSAVVLLGLAAYYYRESKQAKVGVDHDAIRTTSMSGDNDTIQ